MKLAGERVVKILATSFSILIIIAGIFLGVEWMLRKINPQFFCNTIRQFKYDEALGHIAKPNLKFNFLTDHPIEVITNDVGSRNFAEKDVLLQYQRIIFCVGDSYTEGVGNLSDESYPFYLDLSLNQGDQGYRKNFAVLNLGLGSYGSLQAAKTVERYSSLLGKPPDIIIYMISENDFLDDIAFLRGIKHTNLVENSPYFPNWAIRLNQMLETSQVYLRIKSFVRKFKNRLYANEHNFLNNEKDPNGLSSDNLESFLPGMRQLSALSDAYGFKLLLAYTKLDHPSYEIIKEYAEKRGLGFVDYKSEIKATQAAMPLLPLYHTHSGGHFRSWVNLCIARKSSEMIRSLYLK